MLSLGIGAGEVAVHHIAPPVYGARVLAAAIAPRLATTSATVPRTPAMATRRTTAMSTKVKRKHTHTHTKKPIITFPPIARMQDKENKKLEWTLKTIPKNLHKRNFY